MKEEVIVIVKNLEKAKNYLNNKGCQARTYGQPSVWYEMDEMVKSIELAIKILKED